MQRDADWVNWRRGGIGGSDVAAILGLSPWASPYSVWAEKVGLIPGDDETNEAQEFGLRAEPMLAQWFTDRTGLPVSGTQQQMSHPARTWMRCTIDGRHDSAVIEFKTTTDPAWKTIPDYYQCQAQWNIAVTEAVGCWFGVLHMAGGRPRFHTYYMPASTADEAYLLRQCSTFWLDHVLTGTPPAIDGHDATTATLAQMWPAADGAVQADETLRGLIADRTQARAEAARWLTLADQADNTIRAAIGDHDRISDGSRNLATWRWQDRRSVDIDALRAAAPDLVAAHTTTSRSRVLRINTPKEPQ